ncbi:MAG TPA: exosortase/archaeosortase family protein [Acidobacteriota bacterium]|nr:exosortase/archaeosortase family protein [Acidobacteriota bacterium]
MENREIMPFDGWLNKRIIAFAAIVLGTVLVNISFFEQMLEFSRRNNFSSHVLAIPFVSAALLFYRRSVIFQNINLSVFAGGAVAAIGIFLLTGFTFGNTGLSQSDLLSAKALAVVIIWIGAFLLLFGLESSRKAIFALLFLLFMVPIPEFLLEPVIVGLQMGSADMTAFLFKITGTTHFREGVIFMLPGITIEVARECSGIRSSLALLITCLLAGHLMLQTTWRKWVFIAFAVPMAMFKNAIRILVLSLLAIHIDTRFMTESSLHRDGGILFYLLSLVLMLPILAILRRSEQKSGRRIDKSRFES